MKKHIARFWIDLSLKLKQNRWAFLVLFLFYFIGFAYYMFVEPNRAFVNIFLVAWGIRSPSPESATDFSGFYQMSINILVDVVVFSFLIGALLERYNPIATSKIIAEHQRNHTVVLGYHHLGERIVEYLKDNNKPYVLIEYNQQKVLDLINDGEPVVVGDFTDESTLDDANIRRCKEVFFVTNDIRKAIVCAKKIREKNRRCQLYMRAFEDEFQDYLESDPWNAYTFSTSRWTLEILEQWTRDKTGDVIVLGFNHISQIITEYLSEKQKRKVIMINPELDEEEYQDKPFVCTIKDDFTTMEGLEDKCQIDAITQIFICWKSEAHFSEALLLIMEMQEKYPQIEIFVRIYDEETIPIFKQYQATTFSTSSKAFENLQKEVYPDSNLK